MHGINLIERTFHCGWTGDVARHPDREEQRVEPAFLHSRDVDIAVLVPRRNVEGLVEHEPLRGVVVRVDDDGAIVKLLCAGRYLIAGRRLAQDECRHRERSTDKGGRQKEWSHGRDLTALT